MNDAAKWLIRDDDALPLGSRVVARSSDRVTTPDRTSPRSDDTSYASSAQRPPAPGSGRVGRPCHNETLKDLPSHIKLDPENVRNGLAQLVLALVEALRELMERQALRRIDAGSLTDQEIGRVGETFCRLAEEIERLKQHFGFSDDDLNLDLGPLGRLRS
ncbi:MAG: gas vesicle protein K [Planctomycetes bacterium]|nr:gas vesicle protein K [Planctomycetota bacterium]